MEWALFGSRRDWATTARTGSDIPAELAALKALYFGHVNRPFIYRDQLSGAGVMVVFASPWTETIALPRSIVELKLDESL